MLKFKTLTMKNFLSTGNLVQTINLDQEGLTLVLGENLDTTGDPNNSRNGAGKTAILNALSFALFSWPLTPIKKDNLVNKVNNKNMVVVLDFEQNGINYRIERGRKPTYTKWFVGEKEQDVPDVDESQGDSKWTNKEIMRVLGLSNSLFKHIVALNTYSTPFLNMKAKEQRDVIEELLGITQLSQKAEILKNNLNGFKDEPGTKDKIKEEEYRIQGIEDANSKIEKIISDLEKRKGLWAREREKRVERLNKALDELSHIEIEEELKAHSTLQKQTELTNNIVILEKDKARKDENETKKENWDLERVVRIAELDKAVAKLSHIDIDEELEAHYNTDIRNKLQNKIDINEREIKQKTKLITQINTLLSKQIKDLKSTIEHTCPTCGQDVHDKQLDKIVGELEESIKKNTNEVSKVQQEIDTLSKSIKENQNNIDSIAGGFKTVYKTKELAMQQRFKLEDLEKDKAREEDSTNPYELNETEEHLELEKAIKELKKELEDLGNVETHYETLDEVYEHRSTAERLQSDKVRETESINPYIDQIQETRDEGIQTINKTNLITLYNLRDHQQTLLRLLTDKGSFIRKKIIEQNLGFLNHRLNYYLDKLGLPHDVMFKNDLNVEIMHLGQEYDAGNLSRGENNRLILGLSWSFRDVWESMNTTINMMFIDELIDSGTDGQGVEAAIEILKADTRNRGRNIFLISHREELHSRVSSVMLVQKENGFTNFIHNFEIQTQI